MTAQEVDIDYERICRVAHKHARKLPFTDWRDLAQEAALATLSGRKSIDGPMLDWLRRQGWITNHRSASVNPGWERVSFHGNLPNTPSGESRVIALVDLQHLLGRLTPKRRTAIVLQHIVGMTEGEILKAFGTPLVSHRNRQYLGILELKRMIAREATIEPNEVKA